MIQYDRVIGAFLLKEGTESQEGSEACAKLNVALARVREWLGLKRRNGRFAHRFLAELAVNSFDRLFHIHAVYDEIGKLEGTDTTPSMTKKPRRMRAPLHGFWHMHLPSLLYGTESDR